MVSPAGAGTDTEGRPWWPSVAKQGIQPSTGRQQGASVGAPISRGKVL